jgi:uncharacterized membrane protein YeiH
MAVAVSAITDALMASRKQMDIFGFVMLGIPVFCVSAPSYVVTCVTAVALTYFLAHLV